MALRLGTLVDILFASLTPTSLAFEVWRFGWRMLELKLSIVALCKLVLVGCKQVANSTPEEQFEVLLEEQRNLGLAQCI